MGMLENIQTGKENKPPRIMIYGSEGVGKSSTATQFRQQMTGKVSEESVTL